MHTKGHPEQFSKAPHLLEVRKESALIDLPLGPWRNSGVGRLAETGPGGECRVRRR